MQEDEMLLKFQCLGGAKVRMSCKYFTSRQELSNDYLFAKICVDTPENEPLEVIKFADTARRTVGAGSSSNDGNAESHTDSACATAARTSASTTSRSLQLKKTPR